MSLYNSLCDKKLLLTSWQSIYRKKSKNKKKQGKDIYGLTIAAYKLEYLKRIDNLLQNLKAQTYKTSKIKGFLKSKPGKTAKRLIGIAAINDRILQKAILRIITPYILPKIKNSVSFGAISMGKIRDTDKKEHLGIRGAMGHLVNAVSSKNYWVFKSDIESFYDTIPKRRLLNKVVKLLPDPSLND